MIRGCVMAALLLAVTLATGSAGQKPAYPNTPAPEFATVIAINKNADEVTCRLVFLVVQAVEKKPGKDGQDGNSVAYRFAPEARGWRVSLKETAAFDTRGKKLAEETVWQRLKVGATVLLSMDGKKVDPTYLQIVQDDTLVLVPPVQRKTFVLPLEEEKDSAPPPPK